MFPTNTLSSPRKKWMQSTPTLIRWISVFLFTRTSHATARKMHTQCINKNALIHCAQYGHECGMRTFKHVCVWMHVKTIQKYVHVPDPKITNMCVTFLFFLNRFMKHQFHKTGRDMHKYKTQTKHTRSVLTWHRNEKVKTTFKNSSVTCTGTEWRSGFVPDKCGYNMSIFYHLFCHKASWAFSSS
jgi:hypothetical protein